MMVAIMSPPHWRRKEEEEQELELGEQEEREEQEKQEEQEEQEEAVPIHNHNDSFNHSVSSLHHAHFLHAQAAKGVMIKVRHKAAPATPWRAQGARELQVASSQIWSRRHQSDGLRLSPPPSLRTCCGMPVRWVRQGCLQQS